MIAVKSKSLPRVAGLSLFLAAAAAAAPAAAQNPPAATAVTVIASEYRFSPNKLMFQHGQPYRLHLENHGKETHEFTAPAFFASLKIANPGVLNADKTEIVLQPGEAKDLRFVAAKPGRYKLRCADHDWAGMIGQITVK